MSPEAANPEPHFQQIIPTLRIFDEAKAREFYVDFLGFQVQFEHRFQEDFPLYMGVVRGECVLHLSEHHGDGSPGTSLMFQVEGIDAFQQELAAKEYRFARPGPPEDTEFGTREVTLSDPFGNRLTFYQNVSPRPEGPGSGPDGVE